MTFKLSLEEYIGVGQENDILNKGDCLCIGFQAGRDLTGHRNGKEACLGGLDRNMESFWTLSLES